MSSLIRAIGSFFLDIIETVVIALSVFLIIYLFFMQPHQVSGESMVPTFQDKEYLLTDKISYKLNQPSRGDTVVFHAPEDATCAPGGKCDYIKRIIGVPGDTIEVKNNKVFLNNVELQENYLDPKTITQAGEYTRSKIVRLGPDEYFVMGDNREHSSDSRSWGPVSADAFVGRVFFRYWPIPVAGIIKHPDLNI